MTKKIEFVSESKVSLVATKGSDLTVAKAAWVSNFGDEAPEGIHYHFMRDDGEAYWKRYGITAPDHGIYNPFRDSYLGSYKRINGLIDFLYREQHMSPFEHGQMTFLIETPLFVRSEFHRHRTWSYNEMSGRYKELEPKFFLSKKARTQKGKIGNYSFEEATPEQTGLYYAGKQRAVYTAWEVYQERLAAGIAKEQAREELPLSLMTKFYATANPRNIMQFLTLRNDEHALAEIREVAEKIEKFFAEAYPLTYAAYKKHDWRSAKSELEELRKKVAQYEAAETYPEFRADTTGARF